MLFESKRSNQQQRTAVETPKTGEGPDGVYPQSKSVVPGRGFTATRQPVIIKEAMKRDLRLWGIALIVLGVIHFAAARFLDPVWGGIIIVIGILNLCIHRRGMYIVNGSALLLVGIMNILSSIPTGSIGWIIFGLLQLWWGATEIRKFSKYAPLSQPGVTSQYGSE